MAVSAEDNLLTALDVANLESCGLLTPPDDKGFRRIHKRRMNRKYYAAWAKRRTPFQNVVVVHITLPNRAIVSLDGPEMTRLYWPSLEWKEMIWHCRSRKRLTSELRRVRDSTIIIGTISKGPNSIFDLPSAQDIGESHVLRIDHGEGGRSEVGIQYVFNCDNGQDFLIENIRSIKLYSWTSRDSEEFGN